MKERLDHFLSEFKKINLQSYIEFEIRLKNVSYEIFFALYDGLCKSDFPKSFSQTVAAVSTRKGEDAKKIKESTYESGTKIKTENREKRELMAPFHDKNGNLEYKISVASEKELRYTPNMENDAIIRLKSRCSIPIKLDDQSWRIDLTVVRQISGSSASTSLQMIKNNMFPDSVKIDTSNFLTILKLDSAPHTRELYKFEVEAELISEKNQKELLKEQSIHRVIEYLTKFLGQKVMTVSKLQSELNYVSRWIRSHEFIARFRGELNLKKLLPNVVSLTRLSYRDIYPPKGYFLTDKADGKRALAILRNNEFFVIIGEELRELEKKASSTAAEETIVDGEWIEESATFYAFDIIELEGVILSSDPFEKRITKLKEATDLLCSSGMNASPKEYVEFVSSEKNDLKKSFIYMIHDRKRNYHIDGIILVEPGKAYEDTLSYKWKPENQNTIDFLVKRPPPTVMGKLPFVDKEGYKLYFLFLGIGKKMHQKIGFSETPKIPGYKEMFPDLDQTAEYFPIEFAPVSMPNAYIYYHPTSSKITDIDGKIVEMLFNLKSNGWEINRIRDDRTASTRYFGNDYRVAEYIWMNCIDPFPEEQLYDGTRNSYFQYEKSESHIAQTAVMSFAKSRRIQSALSGLDWVVDIGTGKGQDYGRYMAAKIKNLIAIDKDKTALTELIKRRYEYNTKNHTRRNKTSSSASVNSMKTFILTADICTESATDLASKIENLGMKKGTADAVVCNLAAHYFMQSSETQRNFISFIKSLLKKNGTVVLTVMRGEKVHKLLTTEHVQYGNSWSVEENSMIKYGIKRLYESDELCSVGQKIGVLLPFSGGEYYEEYLFNTNDFIEKMVKRGFVLTSDTIISETIPEFKIQNPYKYNMLSQADKNYLDLYGELVFTMPK